MKREELFVNDEVEFKNVLGNIEKGTIIKLNNLTARMITNNFKTLSLPYKRIMKKC